MLTEGLAARRAKKSELEHALLDAHDRTWAILEDLAPEQWQVPYDPGINPPRWEFGHVAWFTEWWVLREAHWNERDEIVTRRASLLPGVDEWFDSGRIAHRDRWLLDFPLLAELRDYARAVLDAVRAKLAHTDDSDRDLYFFRLALLHQDMHNEALTYMRQTLDYSMPLALHIVPLAAVKVTLPAADQTFAILPPTPVKPGDAWTVDFERPNAFGAGAWKIHSENRLLRYEQVAGPVTSGGYPCQVAPWSCDTQINVRSCSVRKRTSAAVSSDRARSSRPAKGSSRTSARGRPASAAASTTRRA